MSFNRLINETSPYLLQHKDNPVHWWPWGKEALAEAEKQNKPILLSIGYAACHWCHVMAHESFEDEATAKLMNELFINIKVDREERPDVDSLYMEALHLMGEQGGWPLTMFLTPKGEPFWGGTYFPPIAKYGRPSFPALLNEISRIYHSEPKTVLNNSMVITKHLKERGKSQNAKEIKQRDIFNAANSILELMDLKRGGVHGAPKFPQVSLFNFLWRVGVVFDHEPFRAAVQITLQNICQGGIYDHVGGGFARYSVDAKWLVPHFEKMLYDNAQLVGLMCDVWCETKDPVLKHRIFETCDWVLREMQINDEPNSRGAFASSFDADSEGEEGKFYIWQKSEIEKILEAEIGAENTQKFLEIYDVTEGGNFEGQNILNRLHQKNEIGEDAENMVQKALKILLEVRTHRIWPGQDDKILADWNGLMITSLAKAGQIFDQKSWIEAAQNAYDFICTHMMSKNRLSHSFRSGKGGVPATSSDYANMIMAALTLYQISSDEAYLEQAQNWVDILQTHYWDEKEGGYYLSADDTDDLLIRQKYGRDDAVPNANGVMISNLNSLFLLTAKTDYQSRAEKIISCFSYETHDHVFSHTGILTGLLECYVGAQILVLDTDQSKESAERFVKTLFTSSLPGVLIMTQKDSSSLMGNSSFAGKTTINGQTTAYICYQGTCLEPVTSLDALRDKLGFIKGLFKGPDES